MKSLPARLVNNYDLAKRFTSKNGVFTPVIKRILEASLEDELDAHLDHSREPDSNRRNGYGRKSVKVL